MGAILALVCCTARAEAPDALTVRQLTEIPFEQLLTLEVSSASKYPQKIGEAPSAAVVVSAEDIRSFGYRTLADILRSMPGLYVSDDHSWSYIGVRGFSRPGDYNTRVLLLVDGYRVNDNIYNQAYIGREFLVDVDLIDRVEFIPGPGASAYGDNAFFGVINVITKQASAIGGNVATLEAGSHDSYKVGYQHGERFENGAELVVSATGYSSQGRDWFFPEYGGVAHDLDGERYGKFFAKLHYQEWTFESGYMRRPKANPAAPFGSVFDDSRYETVDTHAFASANYYAPFSETLDVSGNLYYGMYDYDGTYPYATTLNIDRSRGRRAGAELRLISTAFAGHKLMGGIEYQKDLRQLQQNYDLTPRTTYIDTNASPYKYGLFIQDEYALRSDLLLNAGVRYDHYEWFGDTVNPRLALIYHTAPGDDIKLIYGTAYRAPNVYEMFYADGGVTYKANPDLKPEKIRTYELVFDRNLGAAWHGTASLYHYQVDRLITQITDPLDGSLVFVNEAGVRTNGVELSVEKSWQGGTRLKANVSYQDAKDRMSGSRLVNSPRVLGKMALAVPVATVWQAGMELQYTGARATAAGAEVSGYTLANLTLSRRDILPGLDLSASAYNLLNREYQDPADPGSFTQDVLRQDGRVLRLKLDYRF